MFRNKNTKEQVNAIVKQSALKEIDLWIDTGCITEMFLYVQMFTSHAPGNN